MVVLEETDDIIDENVCSQSNTPIFTMIDTKVYKNTSSLSISSIYESNNNFLNLQSETTPKGHEEFKLSPNNSNNDVYDEEKPLSFVDDNCDEAQVQRYSFLVTVLDEKKRPPSDPDYDCKTLYIPPSAFSKFTPFEKQYWEIKQKFFDAVVFFKKGKFYELYEMDADIAASKFDLKVTDRVNMKMAGVPEATLETWVQRFVDLGYKIAVVRQLENQISKEIRKKTSTGQEKASKGTEDSSIIKREVSCVITSATITDPLMLSSDFSNYVLALKQEVMDGMILFSAVFIDVSTSTIFYCKFKDDNRQYYLETLLLQIKPKEILFEKGLIPPGTLSTIQKLLPSTIQIFLKPDEEFYSSEMSINAIEMGGYFKKITTNEDSQRLTSMDIFFIIAAYPVLFEEIINDFHLFSSFGAILYYLKYVRMIILFIVVAY